MTETKVILKYKRENDCWLCPECDTENNVSLGKCTVCGLKKSPSAVILKQWTEADDKPITPPKKKTVTTPTGPVFKDTDKDEYIPEEENKNKIIWWIVAIIIIGLIIAASQANAQAASLATTEFGNNDYEVVSAQFEDDLFYYKQDSTVLNDTKEQIDDGFVYDNTDDEIYTLQETEEGYK